jgi:hypothetical protein
MASSRSLTVDTSGGRRSSDNARLSPGTERLYPDASDSSPGGRPPRLSLSDGAVSDEDIRAVSPKSPSFLKTRASTKSRDEWRKALASAIDQLRQRSKPPSVFDQFRQSTANVQGRGLGAVVESVRGAVKLKQSKAVNGAPRPTAPDDSDEEDSGVFHTDKTTQLLLATQAALAAVPEAIDGG